MSCLIVPKLFTRKLHPKRCLEAAAVALCHWKSNLDLWHIYACGFVRSWTPWVYASRINYIVALLPLTLAVPPLALNLRPVLLLVGGGGGSLQFVHRNILGRMLKWWHKFPALNGLVLNLCFGVTIWLLSSERARAVCTRLPEWQCGPVNVAMTRNMGQEPGHLTESLLTVSECHLHRHWGCVFCVQGDLMTTLFGLGCRGGGRQANLHTSICQHDLAEVQWWWWWTARHGVDWQHPHTWVRWLGYSLSHTSGALSQVEYKGHWKNTRIGNKLLQGCIKIFPWCN